MSKLGVKDIALLVLCGLVLTMFIYIVFQKGDNSSTDKTEQMLEKYWQDRKSVDSSLVVLRSELLRSEIERIELKERIKERDKVTEAQQATLDYLNNRVFELKQQIDEKLPNFGDSSIHDIDDFLPK